MFLIIKLFLFKYFLAIKDFFSYFKSHKTNTSLFFWIRRKNSVFCKKNLKKSKNKSIYETSNKNTKICYYLLCSKTFYLTLSLERRRTKYMKQIKEKLIWSNFVPFFSVKVKQHHKPTFLYFKIVFYFIILMRRLALL